MKKRNIVILVIVTAILFLSLGVGAATVFNSNVIAYTPNDTSWSVSNLKDAVDSLYQKASSSKLTLIGSYTGAQTINVSSYVKAGDTVNNFIVSVTGSGSVSTPAYGQVKDTWWMSATATFTPPSISYNSSNKTITVSNTNVTANHRYDPGNGYPIDKAASTSLTYKVYYVG